ncbi:DUF488 domain-containing protein [Geobacter argillaceus]|uniref:Uncharacterized protein YeaO (DUF488 family) n=1 Tax=Geobacter argillaceus TaxID=345631 RepID=A0A562VLY5_9BACT|nr:DUF488 domain-containing protein [Geobacter argillaceus]TWJ18895.1 uncharacterized protein YeaO (DUF488 family) [Geobacter argillaceus]
MIKCKRIYEQPSLADGRRVLVDRLWPRGMSKENARIDDWLRELAPSDSLRRSFCHDPAKWDEFRSRYAEELRGRTELLETLREQAATGTVTLLFAARDEEYNNAVVLKQILEEPTE